MPTNEATESRQDEPLVELGPWERFDSYLDKDGYHHRGPGWWRLDRAGRVRLAHHPGSGPYCWAYLYDGDGNAFCVCAFTADHGFDPADPHGIQPKVRAQVEAWWSEWLAKSGGEDDPPAPGPTFYVQKRNPSPRD